MTDFTDFIDNELYPRVFNSIDRLFPEFSFKRKGRDWVSSNKQRLSGSVGENTGSVIVYENSPFYIQDYSSGGKAITTSLQETGRATSWIDSIKWLAKEVGLELPSKNMTEAELEEIKKEDLRADLFAAADALFVDMVESKECQKTKKYLSSRGFADQAVKDMKVGFVPSQANIRSVLEEQGFKKEDIRESLLNNLAIGSTHTLAIPFKDPIGRVIGFVFRATEEAIPKYLYTAGLKRSGTLFGLQRIGGDKDLIIVEGFLDALNAKANGINNIVALGGTSLNEIQAQAVKRYGAEKVTLCLDNDRSGQEATDRAIKVLVETGLKVYVATMPEGIKDPDELIQKKGLDAFKQALSEAKAHYNYSLGKIDLLKQIALAKGELSDKDRDSTIKDMAAIGEGLKDPIEKDLFSAAFHQRLTGLGVSEDSIAEVIDNAQASQEKERQSQEFKKSLREAQRLLNSGQEIEARDLLSKQSKHINTDKSYHHLTRPITELEFIEALKNKPDAIGSGLNMSGEELMIPSGAITILAAPTSHGKTSLQINLALNMAKDIKNKPIYLFSYEENREAILLKAFNTYANKTLSKNNRRSLEHYFKTGEAEYFNSDERTTLIREIEELKDTFFKDLISSGRLNIHYAAYTAEELAEAIRHLHKTTEVGAVIVDYMQLLRLSNNRTNSRQEELKQVCLDLKDCAVETGLPIILGAQFNRTVTKIADIHATAIGEAGDIERIANLIIGFWNRRFPELGESPNISDFMYAKVLKGRDMGAGITEDFSWDGNTGLVSNNLLSDGF